MDARLWIDIDAAGITLRLERKGEVVGGAPAEKRRYQVHFSDLALSG